MEESWEIVAVPAEIQHSTVGKENSSEGPETSLDKNEGNNKSKVCILALDSWRFFDQRSDNLTRQAISPIPCNRSTEFHLSRNEVFHIGFLDREKVSLVVINYMRQLFVWC